MQSLTKEIIAMEVSKAVGEILGIDPSAVKLDATFEGLGANSLNSWELIMDVEEFFSIEIADGEVKACKTVGALVDLVALKKGVVEPGAIDNWNPDKAVV